MGRQMVYEVEPGFPVARVRPRGVLDGYSAPDLRAALMEGLVDQPSLVLVDLSELQVVEEVALTTLASVAREAQVWPGAQLGVTGVKPHTDEALRRMGVSAYVKAYPDEPAATRAVARLPVPPRAHARIEPAEGAPAEARELLRDFAGRVGIAGEPAAAELVASELVTNAVMHAGTLIDFTVRLVGDCLHIAVRDESPSPARISGYVSEADEHGRGLLLVDALAVAWGSLFPAIGKVVWATVKVRLAE